MTAELAVELSDLGGWAAQVGRAGTDTSTIGDYASSHVTDGDFGAILDTITGEYEALIPEFHGVLAADARGLDAVSQTLRALQANFRQTDARVAQNFGLGQRISDDGDAAGFADAGSATPVPAPTSGGEQLPEVSFGFLLDQVCELLSFIGGPDPREYVTRWIAGDIEKAGRHASAWEHAGECLQQVERNLAAGSVAIGRTWRGAASVSAAAHMDQWRTSLGEQSSGMAQMSGYLRDMVTQAVDMAQVVVDIIRTVIDLASAALASAYIPFYGQWKLIRSAREALTLINNARRVLQVFWDALVLVKDGIVMVAHALSAEALPTPPVAPAR